MTPITKSNTDNNKREKRELEQAQQMPKSTKKRKVVDEANPYSDIVYVVVGPEQTHFAVHVAKLKESSTFFKRVLEEQNAKANAKLEPDREVDYSITSKTGSPYLHLPQESANTFKHVSTWIYSRTLVAPKSTTNENDKDQKHLAEATVANFTWTTLIDIYLFAARRYIPDLQNATVDACIAKSLHNGGNSNNQNRIPNYQQINRLFDAEVLKDSVFAKLTPFRNFFVDKLATCEQLLDTRSSVLSNLHPLFLAALVNRLRELKERAEVVKSESKSKKRKKTGEEKDWEEAEGGGGEREYLMRRQREGRYYVQVEPIVID